MELLTDAQVADQISVYQNKIKSIKDKIRDELQERRDLKAKIEEAKQREATQIQILDRLDEYDKVVDKQLELAEKMEDNESLKQLKIIEKYESMLSEQQKIWAEYEEEYERLPLARDRQKAELRLLNVMIQNKLMYHKMQDTKRMIKIKNQIDTQRERMHIVEFSKRFVEHDKRRKHCQELAHKVQSLNLKERELQFEIRELEKKAEIGRISIETKKLLMKPQQLPQVDLSRFIIHRDKNNDSYDTVSINSYMLEQEYMNNDEPINISAELKNSQQKTLENTNQENLPESIPMDIDDELQDTFADENSNFNSNRNEESLGNKNTNPLKNLYNVKEYPLPQQNDLNGTYGVVLCETSNDKNNRKNNSENKISFRPTKNVSQDGQSNFEQTEKRTPSKKRANQMYAEKEEDTKVFVMNGNHQSSQHQNPFMKIQNERLIPSPAKMLKRLSQEQQLQQLSSKQSQSTNNSMDLSRVPQAGNKPRIKFNEHVNYSNIKMQSQNHRDEAATNVHVSTFSQNELPMNIIPTPPMSRNTTQQQATSFSQQNSFSMDFQYNVEAMPRSRDIIPTSMMNATMHSADMSSFADNISAILGSEITEPGGSFELAKRLYADSDMNSEDGDLDYDKMFGKFCSPIVSKSVNQPHQNGFENNNIQGQMIPNNESSRSNSQEINEKNFTFGNFGKKQTQPSQRFF